MSYDFKKLAEPKPVLEYDLSLYADGKSFVRCQLEVTGDMPTKLKLFHGRELTKTETEDEHEMLELAEAVISFGHLIKAIVKQGD